MNAGVKLTCEQHPELGSVRQVEHKSHRQPEQCEVDRTGEGSWYNTREVVMVILKRDRHHRLRALLNVKLLLKSQPRRDYRCGR